MHKITVTLSSLIVARSRVVIFLFAVAIQIVCRIGTAVGQCIDYGDYLHWVGSVDTPGVATSVAVSGSYAYVADVYMGLQVVNIATPGSPVIVRSVGPIPEAVGVAASGNHVYVAEWDFGLHVVDITRLPEEAVIVGSIDTPGEASSIAVSGSYAYVAGGSSGLQVVDISTPGAPVIVGNVDTPDEAWRVTVSGSYAYVADISEYDDSILRVVDITTPESPVIVGSFDTPGYVSEVAISGSYLYVADGGAGLEVLLPQCETPPVPVLITNFEAIARDGSVMVSWNMWSDEGLERFTLYRRDHARAVPIVIAEGDPSTRSHVDASVEPGKSYYYELVIRTQVGQDIRSPVATVTTPGLESKLGQNFPNPFNPTTTIEYTLSERSRVAIAIFDASGSLVARIDEGVRGAGQHRVEWNGRDTSGGTVASGVYFYRLEGAEHVGGRKMVLLK